MQMTVEIVSMGPAVTLSERLFEQIRGAIERGDIAAASKISEPELARRFGVSRGPLREAIGRLEACGLVERRANVGARVVTLSSEGLLEIFQVREALESMAARLAAEHMTDEEIAALRGLLDQHGRQIEEDSGQAYFQKVGDLDFHYRIVQGSRNGQLIKLLCNDLYHLMRLYRYQFGMQSRRAPRAFVEHRMIVDAIEQRDGEMAELLMRHHIRTSRENVKSMLTARAS
ncbi:MAG: GntR family transcriptional regulator [Acidihalobacter sp.]